jgi:small-conductance mechanosensitive channel
MIHTSLRFRRPLRGPLAPVLALMGALSIGLMAGTAAAEATAPTPTVDAAALTPSSTRLKHSLPPAIDPAKNPLRPPDTSNPRATIESLILNLDRAYTAGKDPTLRATDTIRSLRRAALTLDLSEVPKVFAGDVGIETALLLKEVIDRVGLPPLAAIPGAEEVERDSLTRWRVPNTEILIQQVADGPRAGAWLFSSDTVERAAAFFGSVEALPYRPGATPGLYHAYTLTPGPGINFSWVDEHQMPRWLAAEWLEQAVWQWLALLLLLGLATTIAVLGIRLARRAERRAEADADADAKNGGGTRWRSMLALVFALLLCLGVEHLINRHVNITGSVLLGVGRGLVVVGYALLAWLVTLLLSRIPETIIRSRHLRPRGIDSQLLRLGFKLLIIIAVAAMVIDAANRIGLPAYSVLTGLGVGSLAIALAARETLANLFGSIAIMLDRPFAIGDWIKLNGVEGTVEDIGFRSTRIRTFYDSQLSVPNSTTMTATVDNMGRRSYRRVSTSIAIRYDTPPERIEAFVEAIRALILSTPSTRKDNFHVVLNDFAPSSLSIMLYFFIKAPDWSTELMERQRVLLEILHLAERLGVGFAFPTQTIDIERMPGQGGDPGTGTETKSSEDSQQRGLPCPRGEANPA